MNEDELLEIIKQKEEIIEILKKALEDEKYLRKKYENDYIKKEILKEKLQNYIKYIPEIRELLED